jgi:hypothetical protein
MSGDSFRTIFMSLDTDRRISWRAGDALGWGDLKIDRSFLSDRAPLNESTTRRNATASFFGVKDAAISEITARPSKETLDVGETEACRR